MVHVRESSRIPLGLDLVGWTNAKVMAIRFTVYIQRRGAYGRKCASYLLLDGFLVFIPD